MKAFQMLIFALLFAGSFACNNSGIVDSRLSGADSGSERDQTISESKTPDDTDNTESSGEETASLPVNINGAFLTECVEQPLDSEASQTSVLSCTLLDRNTQQKLDLVPDWRLSPEPEPQELLGINTAEEFSTPWHIQFILSSQYLTERLSKIQVILEDTIQSEISNDEIAPISEPVSSTDTFTPPPATSGVIEDQTSARLHSPIEANIHGGTEVWDRIYFDPVSGLYFTNVLSFTRDFEAASTSCLGLQSSGDLQDQAWRLAGRSETETLYAQGIAELDGFTAWFWTSETDDKNASKAFAVSMGNGSQFSYPKVNGNMGYFCVSP